MTDLPRELAHSLCVQKRESWMLAFDPGVSESKRPKPVFGCPELPFELPFQNTLWLYVEVLIGAFHAISGPIRRVPVKEKNLGVPNRSENGWSTLRCFGTPKKPNPHCGQKTQRGKTAAPPNGCIPKSPGMNCPKTFIKKVGVRKSTRKSTFRTLALLA